jgi:hypothetical protein
MQDFPAEYILDKYKKNRSVMEYDEYVIKDLPTYGDEFSEDIRLDSESKDLHEEGQGPKRPHEHVHAFEG